MYRCLSPSNISSVATSQMRPRQPFLASTAGTEPAMADGFSKPSKSALTYHLSFFSSSAMALTHSSRLSCCVTFFLPISTPTRQCPTLIIKDLNSQRFPNDRYYFSRFGQNSTTLASRSNRAWSNSWFSSKFVRGTARFIRIRELLCAITIFVTQTSNFEVAQFFQRKC